MKHLLDVNVLLAGIWSHHPHHAQAYQWLESKELVVCPLVEIGFLRISTSKKAFNAPMPKARELLSKFCTTHSAERIADDLPALEAHPKSSEDVTDIYLAELAAHHGLKLATFDTGINHPAVELVK
jgi:uncharacterized protein